jgi:predicted SAM-dependent methyltransferase
MTNNLLIGAGDWVWDGWIGIDADEHSPADFHAIVPPLPNEIMRMKFSQILASHFIEHLYRWDALTLLKQCYEVLEVGGVLTLEQPDLAYCCKIIAGVIQPPEGKSVEQFGYWGVFGRPELDPFMGHRYGYTPETLSDLVVEAGFDRAKITIGPGKYHEVVRDFTLRVEK